MQQLALQSGSEKVKFTGFQTLLLLLLKFQGLVHLEKQW